MTGPGRTGADRTGDMRPREPGPVLGQREPVGLVVGVGAKRRPFPRFLRTLLILEFPAQVAKSFNGRLKRQGG